MAEKYEFIRTEFPRTYKYMTFRERVDSAEENSTEDLCRIHCVHTPCSCQAYCYFWSRFHRYTDGLPKCPYERNSLTQVHTGSATTPMRESGQDPDGTLTVERNRTEDKKELADLTRANTLQNKGELSRNEVLKRHSPSRMQLRTRSFDEKASMKANKKIKRGVGWAEELVQYQSAEK